MSVATVFTIATVGKMSTGKCLQNYSNSMLTHIISTDEDPGLRIESFAVIKLRDVSTLYYCK